MEIRNGQPEPGFWIKDFFPDPRKARRVSHLVELPDFFIIFSGLKVS